MSRELDDDGYEIVPERKQFRGIKCGKCGMKFDADKAYSYHCPHSTCPIFVKVR